MIDLLLALLVGLAIAAVLMRDLLAAGAVLGAYSLVIASLWCWMNAVDVAFTEAAVGAGISTVLMLAAVARVGRYERSVDAPPQRRVGGGRFGRGRGEVRHVTSSRLRGVLSLLAVLVAGAALLYGSRDMPPIGDASAPANANEHVARYYIEHAPHEGGEAPNMVTSVLADYRGYDTLGETVVIFTAGLCVVLLLRLSLGRRDLERRNLEQRDLEQGDLGQREEEPS